MNITLIADAVFQDKPGGSRMVAWELAKQLRDRGHRVTFLVGRMNPERPAYEEVAGVRILRYDGAGSSWRYFQEGRKAARELVQQERPDLVHVHFAYSAMGPRCGIPPSVPIVRTFHGPWDLEGWVEEAGNESRGLLRAKAVAKRWVRRQIEHRDLQRSRRVTVLSAFFRDDVRTRFGVPEDRIDLIPGGVDLARFRPVIARDAAKRLIDIPAGAKLILSVRRLAARMGLDRLIEAMPGIVAAHPKALLIIGGRGPELPRLQELASRLRVQDKVRFAGFIPDGQLTTYYQAADVFVLPTIALEGFGLVITEALASGTPVIGTPVGAIPEILRPLDPRLVAPDATPAGLAAAVIGFLSRPPEPRFEPEALHQWVAERYSWDRYTEATLHSYEMAMSR